MIFNNMECKSCLKSQPNDFDFCPECGAKVIRNRLTLKNLAQDVFQRFFDIDNTFMRTFRDLSIKPEKVIHSYVQGIRRKYLNPIGYFGIALTLSGLLLFLMRRFFRDSMDYDVMDQGVNPELMTKVMNVLFDLNTLLFIIYIPIFAIAARLTFNKKDYNITEYSVFYMYILAHWSIVSFPISVLTLIFSTESYLIIGFPMLVVLIAYAVFAMQRLHRFSTTQLIFRAPIFSLLVIGGYFGFIMLIYVVLFLTGVITLADFAPVAQ